VAPTPIGSKDTRKDEWIEKFVNAGYSLFRLHGKTPVKGTKNWQKTPYDPWIDGSDFPANYGVVLKPDDLVIDVDPRNFVCCQEGRLVTASGKPFAGDPKAFGLEDGDVDNPILRLLTDAGMPSKPQTFTVKTGGGGLHIYLKKPVGFPHAGGHDHYPGVEFKTAGNYLVGPGCLHPESRKYYEQIRFEPKDMAEAPETLLAIIQREDNRSTDGLEDARDDEGARHRFMAFCKSTPEAVYQCNGNITTYKVAARGRDFGLSLSVTLDIMAQYYNPRCQPAWSPEELKRTVTNAYNYSSGAQGALHPEMDFKELASMVEENADDPLIAREEKCYGWALSGPGKLRANDLGNTASYFLTPDFEAFVNPLYRILRYNEFSDQIEFNSPAPWHDPNIPNPYWTDIDAVQLKFWLSQQKHYQTNVTICHEAAVSLATTLYRYHPVRAYLKSLTWDGVSRLDQLFVKYAGAAGTAYVEAVGKNTMIAAVARAFEPGCQFDHIPILEGKQGTGKTSFVRVLGGQWYKEIHIDPHNKDTIDAMKGAWIIEGSEMEFARKADVQSLKAFITRTKDFVRPAYARTTREFPRSCIIIGTINPEAGGGYLRDNTGNRRFWPVATDKINLEALAKDRDQLWAEATHRYLSGERFYLDTPALVAAAEKEQASRTVQDTWVEMVEAWMVNMAADNLLPELVTASYIGTEVLGVSARGFDRTTQLRIVHALLETGWTKETTFIPQLGKTAVGFRAPVSAWIDDL